MATEETPNQDPAAKPPFDPMKDDCFGPPKEPCLCSCLHCGREFMSDGIWFQKTIKNGVVVDGVWCCPTPNCGGIGYTFDIFPVDPSHPDNEGWTSFDGDDEEWSEDDEADIGGAASAPKEYDPAEPDYAELDEIDEDIEGEEWKHGLQPGDPRPAHLESDRESEARRRWEEEQARYDAPDERPREIDRTGEPDRPPMTAFDGDDEGAIPF